MPFKKGHISWNTGKPWSFEARANLSASHIGKPSARKGKQYHPLTDEHKQKISRAHKKIGTQPPHLSGEKSSNWRGGMPLCAVCCKPLSYRSGVVCNKHKSFIQSGDNSQWWKGGKPKCACGKQLASYVAKQCKKCIGVNSRGPLNRGWKGGKENKLMHNRNRRVLKLNSKGSHTLEEWEQLKLKYHYMCLCCKKQEPFITLTEDHILPLSVGGGNNIENIQPLCRSCNSRKHASAIDYRINALGL
jgi:5-methylcytosine-specific restriction endonuclease McrA